MRSSRLPGKVLMPIVDKPLLWHVVQRVKRSKLITDVVVATTNNKSDSKIVDFCKKNHIEVFRGPEKDVLERYYKCAKYYGADYVIRVTADCPLIDPLLIDKLIRSFFAGNFDYRGTATGAGVATPKFRQFKYPQGLDCEIFTIGALESAYLSAKNPLEREHVTVYIWKRPKKFRLGVPISPKQDYSHIRLTVDWKEDLELVRKIYQKLYNHNQYFGFADVIKILKSNPKLAFVNSMHIGNEGNEKFWTKQFLREVGMNRPRAFSNIGNFDAVVVLAADEVRVSGENRQRIDEGLAILKKLKKGCKFIYIGTEKHNGHLKKYLKTKKGEFLKFNLIKDPGSNTKTQVEKLGKFVRTRSMKKLLIVSHVYHLPRIRRYCKVSIDESTETHFYPVGKIEDQNKQIGYEISKIVKYAKKGDLPKFISDF